MPLRTGDRGAVVVAWQHIVGVTADGSFGPATEFATRAWQAERGLEPTGEVDDLILRTAGLIDELTLGIDVSRIQGAIDWAQVRAAGYAFVIVKVSEGSGYLDGRRLEYLAGARSEGLLAGVYHFARLGHSSPEAQMKILWDGLGPVMPSIGLVLDAETTPPGMTPLQVVEWIARFADVAETYDLRGVRLYSYYSYLMGLARALAGSEAGARVRSLLLWLAHYLWREPGPPPIGVRPRPPTGFARVSMWQCNGGGGPHLDGPVIPGVGVPCDRNVFFGNLEQLRVEWGGLPALDVEPAWSVGPIVRPPVPLGRPALDE